MTKNFSEKDFFDFKIPKNQNVNYAKIFDLEIEKIKSLQNKNQSEVPKKNSLLLHACCAPCSSATLEKLLPIFDISIFYYNPNIFPAEEYQRRLFELENFLPKFSLAKNFQKIPLIKTKYNHNEFFSATNVLIEENLQAEKERGIRCERCYDFRMKKTFEFAAKNNFDFWTTTLSISPHKDSQKINQIGKKLSEKNPSATKYLFADFKKRGGFFRSTQLSQEFSLYRQDFCGCEFSKMNAKIVQKS